MFAFRLAETPLYALASGALYWPDQALLCVSDLHFGKSERLARRGGAGLGIAAGRFVPGPRQRHDGHHRGV